MAQRGFPIRIPLLVAAGVGVVVTVSRSSILAWAIVWAAVGWQGVVSRRQLLAISVVLVFAAIAFFSIAIAYLDLVVGIDLHDVTERLEWFSDPNSVRDDSQSSRREIMVAAWNAFIEHPLAGNGLGYTDLWSHAFSTHNVLLRLMAEQGIVGATLYVALVGLIGIRATAPYPFECRLFALFLFFWAWFSHNILDEYSLLIAIALAAAMTTVHGPRTEAACASRS